MSALVIRYRLHWDSTDFSAPQRTIDARQESRPRHRQLDLWQIGTWWQSATIRDRMMLSVSGNVGNLKTSNNPLTTNHKKRHEESHEHSQRQLIPEGGSHYILKILELYMNATVERERITARVSISVAETLNEAAELAGTTLNNFVVQAALKEAHRLIDREKTIYLSNNDAAMLLNLLENPPPLNAALSKAFERFMKAKYGTGITSTGKSA